MEKGVKIAGIIAVCVILVAIIGYSLTLQLIPSNTISVNGQSQIEVTPDLVTINFNLESSGNTAAEAKDANTIIYNQLILELNKININENEIKTSNFNIYPEYDWSNGNRIEKGYKATHFVTVELPAEQSERTGEIIDAGVNAGALISYINFELSESLQNEKKSEAIVKATEDARLKAEAMAQGLGKNLGKIVSVTDSSFNYNPWSVFSYGREGVAVDEAAVMAKEVIQETSVINPSEQTVYGNVAIVYKIK